MTHNPSNVLFIKLGKAGEYEKECIENKGTIKIGYHNIDHKLCIAHKWDSVLKDIQDKSKTALGASTSHRNQIRKFYEEPKTTMWITFYLNKLWYCYADTNITLNKDGSKERETINGWKDADAKGKLLFTQGLSGRLTKVQHYQGTICDVLEKDYLLHKINATQSLELKAVEECLSNLKGSLIKLLHRLNWKDFETFVDLIFRAAGWSRIGTVGKTTKSTDLELIAPVTNERAIVQIKSESDLSTFNKYKTKFQDMTDYDKYFYIVHTPQKDLKKHISSGQEELISIYDDDKLVELCVNAGLIEWLISVAG